ncbi:MAG: BACON domain-containing protein [Bacteroidales bacterium]|nr:BACON domain-containing protein [Bacteroidales bacterium]
MLRKIFIILAVFLCMIPANAQDCYNYTRNQGISFYNKGDYNAAKVRFIGAKDCPDKPSDNDLDSWIKKCDTALAEKRQREEEERKRREAERKYEYKGYMNIHNVEFKNGDSETTINKYGEEISAVDAKYIYPRVYYSGLANTSKDIQIYVKIIKPDGSLMRGKSSPEGYTYSKDITVSPNSYQYLYLSGWGNKSGGAYVAGTHTFQLWYNGRMIYQQNFTLKESKGALYLTVNNNESVSSTYSASGGECYYSVQSGGAAYNVTLLPSWCKVIDKTASSFKISYEKNTGAERSDWFRVVSGDKSVKINVTQSASNTHNAKVEKITVDHNVYDGNQKGMRIHVKFSVNNMKGKTGRIVAYFYRDNGNPLKDKNSSYCTTGGEVATYEDFTPGYESTIYNDFKIFMPLSELHITDSGKTSCYFYCIVWDTNDQSANELCRSEKYHFTIN